MAKYSKGAQKGVKSAMRRMEKGTLRSGGSDKKVTNPKQAIAIGLSQAKKKGAKVPLKKKATVVKKAISKKPAIKKITGKKIAVKKAAPKKAIAKKITSKKAVIKKPALKKPIPKKAVTKKEVPKKTIIKLPPKKLLPVKEEQQKKEVPEVTSLPEGLVEEPNNTITADNAIDEPSGSGLQMPVTIEDPVTSFDKHMFEKATAKGDPHSKLHLSSVKKGSVRPAGKKPLWRK